MTADQIFDVAGLVCLALGAFLCLAACVGLVRFPDALSRLHAATKPQILGLAFVLVAIGLDNRNWMTIMSLLPVMVFQMITAPVSAHMVGRAGYRTGNFDPELLVADELDDAIEAATHPDEHPAER